MAEPLSEYELKQRESIAENDAKLAALKIEPLREKKPLRAPRVRAPTPPAKTKEMPHRACAPKLGDFEEKEKEQEEGRAPKHPSKRGRGPKGVRKKFTARIFVNSKKHYLGSFATREEAKAAEAEERKKHPSKFGRGPTGVRKKFAARIRINGKETYLGMFATREEKLAAQAEERKKHPSKP